MTVINMIKSGCGGISATVKKLNSFIEVHNKIEFEFNIDFFHSKYSQDESWPLKRLTAKEMYAIYEFYCISFQCIK